MRIATVRQFRDNVTKMTQSKDPIVVLRQGEIAGLYFPFPSEVLPVEFKRDLFAQITERISQRIASAGITEEEILEDFDRFQKARRRR